MRLRRRKATLRVADGVAGIECQVDFGKLGLMFDPATGRRRAVHALIFTAVVSRHMFVWLSFRQTLADVIDANRHLDEVNSLRVVSQSAFRLAGFGVRSGRPVLVRIAGERRRAPRPRRHAALGDSGAFGEVVSSARPRSASTYWRAAAAAPR